MNLSLSIISPLLNGKILLDKRLKYKKKNLIMTEINTEDIQCNILFNNPVQVYIYQGKK